MNTEKTIPFGNESAEPSGIDLLFHLAVADSAITMVLKKRINTKKSFLLGMSPQQPSGIDFLPSRRGGQCHHNG